MPGEAPKIYIRSLKKIIIRMLKVIHKLVFLLSESLSRFEGASATRK